MRMKAASPATHRDAKQALAKHAPPSAKEAYGPHFKHVAGAQGVTQAGAALPPHIPASHAADHVATHADGTAALLGASYISALSADMSAAPGAAAGALGSADAPAATDSGASASLANPAITGGLGAALGGNMSYASAGSDAANSAASGGGSSDDDHHHHHGSDALYIAGGLLLLGGVAAVVASGGSSTPTPTPTPTPTNHPPVFDHGASQSVATDENVAVAVTAHATDQDSGDTLAYSISTNPAHGTVTGSGGTYTYTPSSNYFGSDSFVVQVSDGHTGGTVTETVNVTVNEVNQPPTNTVPGAQTVNENGPNDPSSLHITGISVSDADSQGGTESVTLSVAHGALDIAAASGAATIAGNDSGSVTITGTVADIDATLAGAAALTYTPTPYYYGSDTLTVLTNDNGHTGSGGALTATSTVPITVSEVPLDASIDVGTFSTGGAVTIEAGVNPLGLAQDYHYHDQSGQNTNVVLANFHNGDTITTDVLTSAYNFTSVNGGQDIQITYDPSGGVENQIILPGLAHGAFIFDQASAEEAAGFHFFFSTLGTSGGSTYNNDGVLDVGTINSPAFITEQAGTNTAYTDNANIGNNVYITGFHSGDTITLSNAATSDFNFGTTGPGGHDIQIVYNHSGIVDLITLVGANPTGALVNSEATAEQVVGSNFFVPAGSSTPPSTVGIDNGTTLQSFDGSAGNITFTDNANVSTTANITGFTSTDTIAVTNATVGQYNFGETGTTIDISYNAGGGVNNVIHLVNAVTDTSVFVVDYASAEQALGGHNFMTFA